MDLDLQSDSSSGGEVEARNVQSNKRKFSTYQTSLLNSLYCSGMKGVGRQYNVFIQRAANETGLTVEQVKVELHNNYVEHSTPTHVIYNYYGEKTL